MKNSMMQKTTAWLSLLLLNMFFNSAHAVSPLTSDLQNLLSEAQTVNTQLADITLTENNMCSELLSAHQATKTLINNIETVNASLSAPLSLDNDSLQALDDLSTVFVSLASRSTALSLDLNTLNSTTEMFAISNGLTAMLRLADDIGVMADRILEMSDKILVMADNIGLMADRIIITQQIQSDNLALTQASILSTQQNSIALVSVVNSNTYEVEFNAQTLSGQTLAADISATALTTFSMARKWADIATDTAALLAQVKATHETVTAAAESNTATIDVDSYAALVEMSIMVNSIGIATQGLALATEVLSPLTRDATLNDSMSSVLQVSADIGVMADRILEMADLILAMADNIGLTAEQIIATQQLQSTNYAATLASVEATQEIVISIIAVNSL